MAVASAIAVPAAIVVASAPHGPGISPDSALYLSVAEKLVGGEGLRGYGDEVLVVFPPGYPLLLAGLDLIPGVSPGSGARVGDGLILGLVVLVSWGLLRRLVLSPPLRVAGVLLIAAATTLVRSASFVWSEPLFMLVSLAAIWALSLAVGRPASRDWFLAAALAAEAAFFVRYVGLVLVPLGAVAFLLTGRRQTARRPRLMRAAAFSVAAGAGAGALIVRNATLSSGPFGPRDPVTAGFGQTVTDVAPALSSLVAPFELAPTLRVAALALTAALGAGRRGARVPARRPGRDLSSVRLRRLAPAGTGRGLGRHGDRVDRRPAARTGSPPRPPWRVGAGRCRSQGSTPSRSAQARRRRRGRRHPPPRGRLCLEQREMAAGGVRGRRLCRPALAQLQPRSDRRGPTARDRRVSATHPMPCFI